MAGADMSGIFWVETPDGARLAVVARPTSPSAFTLLKTAGVDVLVSLLGVTEAQRVGLGDAEAHCTVAGIELIRLPIVDHGVPDDMAAVDAVVARVDGHLAAGRGVAAHCYAGLGRSPLLVAAVLIRRGLSDTAAIDAVSEARGFYVPEMESQHDWLAAYAERWRSGRG